MGLTLALLLTIAASPVFGAKPGGGGGGGDVPDSGTIVNVCATAARTITYDVVAIETIIPINGWGDHIPNGLIYALQADDPNPDNVAAGATDAFPDKTDILANPNLTSPIVLRANVGDCIVVNFRNDIVGKRVGMHVNGVSKDPKASDGARIGNNPDTTVATGQSITYTWYANREGQYVINDYGSGMATELGGRIATTALGLYGALIVEPTRTTWHDPISGRNLLSPANVGVGTNVFADVHGPVAGDDFRDAVYIFLDENEDVLDVTGKKPIFPLTGIPDSTFGINYRSEPLRNRLRAVLNHRGENPVEGVHEPMTVTLPNGTVIKPKDHFCDGWVPELGRVVDDPAAGCMGEEFHLQSWPFGDQGKLTRTLPDGTIVVDTDNLIPKAYISDPIRHRLVHPGLKETHTWHQHTMRWRHEPDDPDSTRLDVISTGPGQTFELRFEEGAGSLTKTPGDSIHHCHLYPHFAQGFWGDWRVFDKLRTGPAWQALNQKYPDGVPIQELKELPDRAGRTPAPDEMHPGFPLFVKGDYLQKAYRPPGAIVNDPFAPARRPGDTVRLPNALEKASMTLGPDGKPIPGVVYVDPCPAGAPQRKYYPTVIDAKIVYNKAGWYDSDGRLNVETLPPDPNAPNSFAALDKADQIRQQIEAGQFQPEPYTIRSRVGECVNIYATNGGYLDDLNDPRQTLQAKGAPIDIHGNGHSPDGDVFHGAHPIAENSTHVHLVRFDELGSDGTSVSWNYNQSMLNGQTEVMRWYVDVPLRTVFFHSHQFPTTYQQHGMWNAMNVEPQNSTFKDPKTGNLLGPPYLPTPQQEGDSGYGVGTVADIHIPPTSAGAEDPPDFREFTVHYSDFVPQFDAAGLPINPPFVPDAYGADQGVMAVNYRNEPFPIRVNSASKSSQAEPAFVFSSAVHGDPSTPVFRAYSSDPVVIRLMDGAHEEEHNFNLAGHRWLHEPDDPNSNLYDTQAMNIAEFFNFEIDGAQVIKRGKGRERAREASELEFGSTIIIPQGAGAPADYLYSSQPMNDLWVGMWGLFRVPNAQVADLKPLPDGPQPPPAKDGSEWPALKPGQTINTDPPNAGNPCPLGAPNRAFNILAFQQKLVYNRFGDNDPNGVIYVLDKDLNSKGVPAAGAASKPLFIRANEGECVNINFTNKLKTAIPVHLGDPVNPVENVGVTNLVGGKLVKVQATWPAGARAGVHVSGLIRYDAAKGDGSAVGFNFDSTVAPGKTISYKYYVDTKDIGAANFSNWANIRGTRHHGAWGGLMVEPLGASHLNPKDGTALASGEQAVIKWTVTNPDGSTTTNAFREFVTDFQDGLNLFNAAGVPIPDESVEGAGQLADPEDQGEKGMNYRSERFANRLAVNPELAWVMSSQVHGDPATPVYRAYKGDPVMVRALNGQDLPRAHVIGLSGHEWRHELNDPNSTVINGQGGFNTSRAFNLDLIGGAGGAQQAQGDYLVNCRLFFHHLSGGIWGLVRVHDTPKADLKPLF